jgi:hypothetical protein
MKMPGKFAWFLTLAVFSGLSMNLILMFGIGLQRIAFEDDSRTNSRDFRKDSKWVFLVWLGIYYISVMLLWLFFSILQSVLFLGFLEYIMIFPVSALYFTAVEALAKRMVLKMNWRGEIVSRNNFISDNFFTGESSPRSAFSGMTGAALFIILGLAGGFGEAAMLAFGFSAGAALAVLITGEIRRRSAMESIPDCLRGAPLILAAMGLLSLVFISAAAVFYAVLGVN